MTVDELFDAWERAWSGRDPRAFEPLCADAFAYEDPLTPEPLHGVPALRRPCPDALGGVPGRARERDRRAPHRRPLRLRAVQDRSARTRADRQVTPTGRFVVVHAIVYAELTGTTCCCAARAFFDLHGAATDARRAPKHGTGREALLLLRGFGLRA